MRLAKKMSFAIEPVPAKKRRAVAGILTAKGKISFVTWSRGDASKVTRIAD